MNRTKIIILIIALFGAMAIVVGTFSFYKTKDKTSELESELKVEAIKLLNDYKLDEVLANEKYLDRIVEIHGDIVGTEFQDGNMIVLLGETEGEEYVQCTMSSASNTNITGEVTIRGYCAGYLLNVIINRAVIVDNN